MTRVERIAELIKKEVSAIIRADVSDPRIGFVSITKVKVSPDLENAKIFISTLGNEEQKQDSMQGLASAKRFIRGKLGDVLELRGVPELRFVRDDSLEKGSNVLSLITKLKREKK
ncbi:MAG: 30S ribosome-binding factor RbfA [bacterium]